MKALVLAFAQADQRPRHAAIDRDRVARATAGHEVMIADGKLDVLARKLAEAVLRAAQRGTACPGWHGQGACGGKRDGAADKVAAGKGCHL